MLETFHLLLPQTVLIALACLFFLGGTFRIPAKAWGPLALGALIAATIALTHISGLPGNLTGKEVVLHSPLTLGIQILVLLLGLVLVLSSQSSQEKSATAPEFYGLLLFILAGVMLVTVANDLILLFLSLELISVPTYVLLYLGRRTNANQEATLKYFLLSVLSAAILLYGFALLYGLTGSTHLGAIREVLAESYPLTVNGHPNPSSSVLGTIALVMIFAGLAYKLAAVPFHFYAPDVYQGTSSFNAGLLSIAPKVAGIVALVRVGSETLVGYEIAGSHLALILAAVTMLLGNCLAVVQTNVRRMLAYSGVAHAGYMLIGISVGFWDSWHVRPAGQGFLSQLPDGVQATFLYLVTYCFATAGLFAVLTYLTRANGREIEHVDDLTGLGRTQPLMAASATLFLFSLAGIPPLPGFWGKLSVIASSLSVHTSSPGAAPHADPAFVVLAIVAMLSAAIGAVAYLRLIGAMYLSEPISVPQPTGGVFGWSAVISSAVLVLVLGIWPRPLFYLVTGIHTPKVPTSVSAVSDLPQRAVAGPKVP